LAEYRIFETETFQEDMDRISRSGLQKIREKLQEHVYPELRNEPHFGPNIKRLKNWEPPTWRVRIGAWRFFYEIDENEKTIFMTAADHRSRSY
jgi:mRNA interferase RelE/StbE